MADTRRTLSALQALLADNVAGDISPQDIRDMLVSLAPPYGAVEMNENATATTISTVSTPVVANWDSNGAATNLKEFSVTTAGRLTYTGSPTIHAKIRANLGFFVTVGASKHINFYIYKNGLLVDPHQSKLTNGSSNVDSMAVAVDVGLATNDYLEIWTSNETDSNDVTLEDAYLWAEGILI